jgi:hypothetical protein
MRNIISIMRDINTFMTEYDFSSGDIVEKIGNDCGNVLFFSKAFLKHRNFVVAPIWSGSLQSIALDLDRKNILSPFDQIQTYLRVHGYDEVNYVCIDWRRPWDGIEGMTNYEVAHQFISLHDYDLKRISAFDEKHIPYWGDNILFTKDLSLVVYFDGDEFAALAGTKECLAKIIPLTISECIDRFIVGSHPDGSHHKWNMACAKFCRDVLEMELEKPHVPQ